MATYYHTRGRRFDSETVMRRRIWQCPFCRASRQIPAGRNALAACASLMKLANEHIAEDHPGELKGT